MLLAALEAKKQGGWFSGRSEQASIRQTLTACITDANLWKLRLPKKDKAIAEIWFGAFGAAMSYVIQK
jgi:hypothetical protein